MCRDERCTEREIRLVLRRLLALRLANAEGERLIAVLPVPRVAEIRRELARPEKRMRRRKDGDGSGSALLGDQQAIG